MNLIKKLNKHIINRILHVRYKSYIKLNKHVINRILHARYESYIKLNKHNINRILHARYESYIKLNKHIINRILHARSYIKLNKHITNRILHARSYVKLNKHITNRFLHARYTSHDTGLFCTSLFKDFVCNKKEWKRSKPGLWEKSPADCELTNIPSLLWIPVSEHPKHISFYIHTLVFVFILYGIKMALSLRIKLFVYFISHTSSVCFLLFSVLLLVVVV